MQRWRDRILVRRILAGDTVAGERFVTAHYARVYRFLRFLVREAACVEDLTQQTFVKAWQALPQYSGEAALSTWLERVAYREYLQWLRARREHASLEDALEIPGDERADAVEVLLLREALKQLPFEYREVCVLHHVRGMTVGEIAALLEIPAGTVKSRLFAARGRLRELMAPGEEKNHGEVSAPAPKCSVL